MASVNSVSSSNINSLYGNRNVISGLASGMDTESMIENSVSGIRTKISGLQQKQTRLEWQQEAYRTITDKMVQFSRKYTSYTSATNLLSASFFNKAVLTTANGANASKVSATGKTGSNVQINGVAQLATASRYQVADAGVLNQIMVNSSGGRYIEAGSALQLDKEIDTSELSGAMNLVYSRQTIALNFDETTVYESLDEFASDIRTKLDDQQITFSDGTTKKASEVIEVNVENGKLTFSDKAGGNEVYISGTTGKLKETLGDISYGQGVSSLDFTDKDLKSTTTVMEQIAGKTMSFSLDGITKKITLPTLDELKTLTSNGTDNAAFAGFLNNKLAGAFGSGKITAELENGKLKFTANNIGSNLVINSEVNETIGLNHTETTYLNTGKSLGDLLGTVDGDPSKLGSLTGGRVLTAPIDEIIEQKDGTYRDAQGNVVNDRGERLGKDGELLYGFDLTINGKVVGSYTRETSLETIMVDINSNSDVGLNVNYSKLTNEFVFNATETGAGHGVSISGELGETLFGAAGEGRVDYTEGVDAILNLSVNGSALTVIRSSNTFDVDGLSVSINGTFNGSMSGDTPVFDFLKADGTVDTSRLSDPVTFTTKSDADKIVGAIKSMVEDYNAMVKEIKDAFSTVPAQKSDGSKYNPLTDTDLEGMSETAIKNYEEKAKQGVIFGDSDLSSLYNKLVSAIAPSGTDGTALRNMGIGTDYSEGLTTLSLDEDKLRDTLNANPDAVRNAFTKVAGEGSNTNGLMQNLKKQVDAYSSTQGTKGILINKAGSKYNAVSLLDNSLKDQIDSYDDQIEKWQTKLTDKVDYYTRQFSRLEQLISQMNSQSSSIMSMMGTSS